ncbi:hypothetical protein SFR_4487 [Streptomyces sp. FR-008]|nr:hypothetical protein SFR_4487 [Streptomyces sp. FR-008]
MPLSRSVASSHSFSSGTQNGWLSVAVTGAVCCRSQWAQAHPAPESTSPRTAVDGGKGHQAVSEVVHDELFRQESLAFCGCHDEQIEALADLGGEFPHPDHDMMYPSPRDYTFSLNS